MDSDAASVTSEPAVATDDDPTVAPLPVAPLPVAPPGHRRGTRVVARPGHLLAGWGTFFWLSWLIIAGSFGAVWYSSRVTGLSTWWLGPETEPRVMLTVIPYICPFLLAFMALRFTRYLPYYGIGGALVTAGIAAGEISGVPGYAAIEFALAGAGLAVSVACFAGMLRPVKPAAQGSAAT